MKTESYNGWSNRETWCVNLWLSNDEITESYISERALDCLNDAEGDKEDAAVALAREIEAFLDENMPDVSGVYADLLSSALADVDWEEIAAAWLSNCEYVGPTSDDDGE